MFSTQRTRIGRPRTGRAVFALVIGALLGQWIAGCVALTPEPAPEPTTTPAMHHWQAQPVVALLYTGPGYTMYQVAWGLMPALVVYADGQVLVTRYDYTGSDWLRSVQTARITPAETCALLTQIEANGFFDFDPNDYSPPQVTDMGDTHILVDAWRSNSVGVYALDFALDPYDGSTPDTPVPPALADTYRLLANYAPPNAAPYQPERIALLISPNRGGGAASEWPLTAPALKTLAANMHDDRAEVVLEGPDAAAVYALFGSAWMKSYTEGGTTYLLTVRPLLPYEIWEPSGGGWGRTPRFDDTPKIDLTCAGDTATRPNGSARAILQRMRIIIPDDEHHFGQAFEHVFVFAEGDTRHASRAL